MDYDEPDLRSYPETDRRPLIYDRGRSTVTRD